MKCKFFTCIIVVILLVTMVACDVWREHSEAEMILSKATLDSLMFSLDGVVYTLPVHFSELEANGWTPYDTESRSESECRFATDTLEPSGFASWELINDNQNVVVRLSNLTEEVLPVGESYVTAVSVLYEVYDAQIVLPGNISFGSTYRDVTAVFGVPDGGPHVLDDRITLFYDSDYYVLQISIDTERDQVMIMSLRYFGYLDEHPAAASALNSPDINAKPEIIREELSDVGLDSLMFCLDGAIYTLPVHFSELEANGWIPYDPDNRFATEMSEPGDVMSWMLINSNNTLFVGVTNRSEKAIPLREGIVVFLAMDFKQSETQIILPENITRGSTLENVISVYGQPNSIRTSDHFTRLTYYTDYFDLQIVINDESNLIWTIGWMYY